VLEKISTIFKYKSMNFLKKNWITLSLTAFLLAVLLIPSFKEFVTRQILMKPSLEKVENEVTFTPEELNLQLKGVNVPDANLADFKGKVVFLNFWGTWCPPCRAEYPSIQKLYEAKKDKVQFVLADCYARRRRKSEKIFGRK